MRLIGTFMASVSLLVVLASCNVGEKDAPAPSTPDLSDHPVYSTYDYGEEGVIDVGVQPLLVTVGALSEVMKRDAVLQRALSAQGLEIRFHPFLKGADVNFFLYRGDLEVAFGGDMPALTACATSDVLVVALTRRGFISIVARRPMLMKGLRGKRIGYAFGSTAHYALLQALSSAGLEETDIRLVRLNVNEMPDALAEGEIDVFTAWEPTPTIALTRFDDFVVIHRSLSTAFLYFSGPFADQYPEAIRLIVASQLRSMGWMRSRKENLLEASRWAGQAGAELSGQEPVLSEEQYAGLVKSDLLDISSDAAIPERDLAPGGRLFQEFEFLQGLGKISNAVDWEAVSSCFDLTIIDQVLLEAQKYQLAVCRSNQITGYNYTVYSGIPQLHTVYGGLFAKKVFSSTNC